MTEMSAPEAAARQISVSDQTGREHATIIDAVQVLEAALAAPSTGREAAWRERVAADLTAVVDSVVQHCEAAEAPGGLVQEIEATIGRPRSLRRVIEDHRQLGRQARELAALVADEPGSAEVREQASQLTVALRAHQAREADLIYEAFFRQIGAGD